MKIRIFCLFLLLSVPVWNTFQAADPSGKSSYEKLLGFLISNQLSHKHYNRKERRVDDILSRDAFKLYLKRLDSGKRVLLAADVEELRFFEEKMDDLIKSGSYTLVGLASGKLKKNYEVVEKLVKEILDKPFDFEKKEDFESDADKLDYCNSFEELKERWRQTLKYQCLREFLHLSKVAENKKKDAAAIASGNVMTSGNAITSGNLQSLSSGNSLVSGNVLSSGNTQEVAKKVDLKKESRDKIKKSWLKYFKLLSEKKREDHLATFYNSITMAFDPHSNYMTPRAKEDFDIRISKSLTGIGASLRETDEGFIRVEKVILGSASYRQGDLKKGDLIMRVSQGEDGHDEVMLTGMPIREVVDYIRGDIGTVVKLTLQKHDGSTQVISIVRDMVVLKDSRAKSSVLKGTGDTKVGYIFLPDFYRDFSGKTDINSTDDIGDLLVKLKKENIEGLIVDLRNNGGGALEDARLIAGLFIEKGPIVQIRRTNGYKNILRDDDPEIVYGGPLIIMVNQFSASASEILAAALQDYGRAVIVGEGSGQTHGKGTVQNLIGLDRLVPANYRDKPYGSLKLTIQKFYRINGASTQKKGVMPDIRLPGEHDYIKSTERDLDYALKWDTIEAIPRYRRWPSDLGLEALKKESEARVAKNEILQVIRERGAYMKERSEITRFSLRLEEMREEKRVYQKREKEYKKLFDKYFESLGEEGLDVVIEEDLLEKVNEETAQDSLDKVVEKTEEKSPEEREALDELKNEKKEKIKFEKRLRRDPHLSETKQIMLDMIGHRKSLSVKP